jgi:predicted transcriptional regulator
MRPLTQFSLHQNNPVTKAARIFIKQGINYLPIKNEQRVVGILNSRELFFKYYETTKFKIVHRHWLGINFSISAFFKKSALRLIGS